MPADARGSHSAGGQAGRGVELERLVATLVRSVATAAAENAGAPLALRSATLRLSVAFCGAAKRPEVIVDSERLSGLPPHAVSTLEIELFAGQPARPRLEGASRSG